MNGRRNVIAIIDYGLSNLYSVKRAFEKVGSTVEVTNKPAVIEKAHSIVLPDVGAFYIAMANLRKYGLIPIIKEAIANKKPFLGICMGLQVLFEETEEHGRYAGIGILKGKVKKFTGVKVPHIGWNQLLIKKKISLFNGIKDRPFVYFVHSYYIVPEDKDIIACTTDYGIDFVSCICKENIFGVQFHPEKSHNIGLKILRNFVERQ